MGLRETNEVIDGQAVRRFNGNNPSGSRRYPETETGAGLRRAPRWVQAKAASQAAKRAKEAAYAWRYLGGP